ncbi:MAG: hypothetical protein GY832_25245 [Chloroflexi bacterium]|nr:hypothetical protein [Chloroflexota bacterium]
MLLEGKTVQLQVTEENLAAFLSCLGIGTLFAIRAGVLSTDAGIWSLGVPRVWEPFIGSSKVSQEIIKVLQSCDELSAIQKLQPDKLNAEITQLIDRLQAELGQVQDPVWQMEWLGLDTDS